MADVRKIILNDLVTGLGTVSGVMKATEYMMSLDNAEKYTPSIEVIVDSEEPISTGSNRYRVSLGLYVKTEQSLTGIEDLIEDIKDYIRTASISNVLELLYAGHEVVPKEEAEEGRYAAVKIILSLLYKDTNTDTVANTHPNFTINGYMSIAHYKMYALMVSGSTTLQALGTNVYDCHNNANIDISSTSGSLSVDIVDSNVVNDQSGIYNSLLVDDNNINLSIRAHYPSQTANRVIEPFMYAIVNLVRTNTDLGHYYRVLGDEPFSIVYNQTFEESGTAGSELTFAVRRYWTYG